MLRLFRCSRWLGQSGGRNCWGGVLLIVWLAHPGWAQPSPASYNQALSYLEQRKFAQAITLLQQVLKKSPRDVKAQNLMGLALTASGKLEEANAHFQKALQLNPKFYPALKNLAMNELALKRTDRAKAHFELVLRYAPRDPVVHLSLGEIYFSEKDFPRAVDHYLQTNGLFLRDSRTLMNFAVSCFKSSQATKAAGALELLGAEADSRAHFQAGLMLAQLEKYEAAARQFELARKGYPDAYEVGFNLTLAYIKSRNYPSAIRTGRDLISQGYHKAELYNLLSEAYEGSGQTVEAYNALRTATQIEPRDETNYLDLIALCVDHVNYDLALEIANIGLQNIPGSYRLLLQRGAVRAMKAQYNEAEQDFEEAARLDPKKNLPYYAMAMAEMQRDQMPQAIEILRRRVAVSPDDYLLLYALGESINRAGTPPGSAEEEEALQALEKSVRLNPNFAHSRDLLGRILLKRGEVDRSIPELEKALQLDPTDLSPAYQLAIAYRKKGDTRRAHDLLAQFEQFKDKDRQKFGRLLHILREGEQ